MVKQKFLYYLQWKEQSIKNFYVAIYATALYILQRCEIKLKFSGQRMKHLILAPYKHFI